jgi:flagellar biosynthesis protein FlhF
MNVKRFVGANSRLVLQQVREEFGPDAVILANNSHVEGIEIIAVSQRDMAGLVAAPQLAQAQVEAPRRAGVLSKTPVAPSASVPSMVTDTNRAGEVRRELPPAVRQATDAAAQPLSLRAYVESAGAVDDDDAGSDRDAVIGQGGGQAVRRAPSREAQQEKLRDESRKTRDGGLFAQLRSAQPAASVAARAAATHPPLAEESGKVLAEIQNMKGLLTEQLATLAWGESVRRRPLRGVLLREMIGAGFGAVLARAITEKLPDDFSEAQSRQWLHRVLARNLSCPPGPGIVERGGIFALVGPTGVGKTTTAAKIAAQCVVRHGARGLGLITTDGYRVGAHDQLRIYGKILGVPVFVAQDAAELQHAIDAVAGKHLVLIDTTGMGQRDERMAEQQALLSAPGIERLLLLNATSQTETLDDVVRAYTTGNICGAVITKVDEAVRLGGVLDVAIRRRLPLHYFTNGQRVPEDIHSPSAQLLVNQALKDRHASASDADLVGLALGVDMDAAVTHA